MTGASGSIKYAGTFVPLLTKSGQELSDKVDRLEKALKAAQDRPSLRRTVNRRGDGLPGSA